MQGPAPTWPPLPDTPHSVDSQPFQMAPWRYTNDVSTSPTLPTQQVGILVLDTNAQGGSAVKQILDSEGWRVRVVGDTRMLLAELKTGEWSLVIANVALTGVDGAAFVTLRELASASPADGGPVPVPYLVPELAAGQYCRDLQPSPLPHLLRPYHPSSLL